MRPDADLRGCTAAHALLLASLADLTDARARSASSLPGWSVGHVITHLARNADAFRRVVEGAGRGDVASMYDSMAQRDSDIGAGAGRPAVELLADLTSATAALEQAWSAATASTWETGRGTGPAGQFGVAETPWRRWRETSIHHGDLSPTFDATVLSEEYLLGDLPRHLADLPRRLDIETRRHLMAWLLDRADSLGDLRARPWQAPPAAPANAPTQPKP